MSFAAKRVPSRRGSPPVFILGFVLLIGALVAVGVGGQSSAEPRLPPAAVDASAVVTPQTTAGPSPGPTSQVFPPDASSDPGQLFESGPGALVLTARLRPGSVSVHGDVFLAHVTWAFVLLQDETGRPVGWTSVSVPGAAGPARGTGPTLRFDVTLTVPDDFAGGLWLDANAYDASGATSAPAASVRLDLGP